MLVIQPQHDRTEIRATALGLGIPSNHRLETVPDFDLQPLPAALLLVRTIPPFGQNPFQALLARDLKERFAVFQVMVGVPYGITRYE